MSVAVCPGCRARYKVPETAAGKRTTCKKCGQAFRIAAPVPCAVATKAAAAPPPAEPQPVFIELEALAQGEAISLPRHAGEANGRAGPGGPGGGEFGTAVLLPATLAYAATQQPSGGGAAAYLHYFAAVGRSLVFLRKPGNILTFMIVWVMLAISQVLQTATAVVPSYSVMIFFGVGSIIITGWYMAFKMNLVAWAAGEEEELPGLAVEDGWWDGILIPFFRMLAAYVFALLPAGLFLAIVMVRMARAAAANIDAVLIGANPVPGSAAAVVLTVMAAIGLFIWPMLVLAVSCGGSVAALFRLDLIGETVLKSLPAYLLTVLTVYISFAVQVGITALIWTQVSDTSSQRENWLLMFLLPTLLMGVNLFCDIIAMRAIGSYYAHFKHKFAWSWG